MASDRKWFGSPISLWLFLVDTSLQAMVLSVHWIRLFASRIRAPMQNHRAALRL